MKTKIALIALLIIIAFVLISLKVFQSSDGPHGGTVKKAGNYNIEMKNPYGSIYAFLLDGDLKPMNNKGITCDANLFFSDSLSTDIHLTPFGTDGFSAESVSKHYSLCKIIFHVSGKNVSAAFENETLFVEKKQ